jgi:uracil-DNA glycosylase family 4
MRGFFAASTLKAARPSVGLAPKCGACGLYKSCQTPKMPWRGQGKRGVLIVGEAPGQAEDMEGRQFVGKAGQLLQEHLRAIGVDMERDCWTTNALICRPPANATPDDRKVAYCRPNLLRTVQELKPRVVILLGPTAVKSFIGSVWKDKVGPITKWVGWRIPCQKPNTWICPSYHPSYLMRENNPMLDRVFRQHLKDAFKLEGHPWEVVPDWEKEIEVILDPREAAAVLRKMQEKGGPIAYDQENTCLKPEYEGAEIVCASMCWRGKKTIAYPWHGEARRASLDLVADPRCQLIASNLKHEDRWTQKDGGTIGYWLWDTMLAAHVLDNRPGVTGLKFQSFVNLGIEAYDDHIHEFLKAKKDKHTNRIKEEVDLRQLLVYCGFDTLLEYKLADIQMGQMTAQAESMEDAK